MKRPISHVLAILISLPLALLAITNAAVCQTPDTLQAHFTVQECDSLIKANELNPNFVILDVRTSGEYIPQHLEGAINRDYYNPNFSQIINSLPKHKMYLIHCASGGRSGLTYNLMLSFGFPQIVNMQGGIGAWNAATLPTTASFAPLLMGVSDSLVGIDTIAIGQVDTIRCTITNRANDTLRFTSISNLTSTEFWTDFDTSQYLLGASDYTFSIFYGPTDTIWDSLVFIIQSNGGIIDFHVTATGVSTAGLNKDIAVSNLRIYPNPSSGNITVDFGNHFMSGILSIRNMGGQIIQSQSLDKVGFVSLEILGPPGIYLIELISPEGGILNSKILKL